MSFNINNLYKLIDDGKYVQAVQWIQKTQQQNIQFNEKQMLNSLLIYCQIQTGRQGDTLTTLNQHQQPPSDQLFLMLSQTDGLIHYCNNIVDWKVDNIFSQELQTKTNYLRAAACLFNRRFDVLLSKDKLQKIVGKERDTLSLCCRNFFLSLIQNTKLDYDALIQFLNIFVHITFEKKIYKLQGQRLNRQHAFSIIHNIIHFIAIQAPQMLDKITDIENVNETIIQSLNFRLYIFIKYRFDDIKTLLTYLLNYLAEKKEPDGEVGQYLLRYYKTIQQMEEASALINKITAHTEYTYLLKLIVTKQLHAEFQLNKNIHNLLLVHDLYGQGAITKEQLLKLDEYFHSISQTKFEHVDVNMVKDFVQKHNGDAGKLIEAACKIINADGPNINSKIIQYFKTFEEQFEDYYYVGYRLGLATPSEFLRNIQISNYLYITALPRALKGYLDEDYETFKNRNSYQAEDEFYRTSAFCSIRLQNHTETQLWEVQNAIQANCLMMSNIIYQNFTYIYEALLETCNLMISCRLYETKSLIQNIGSYYCSTIYTALQLNNLLQDLLNGISKAKIISNDNLLLYFNGTLGKMSGNNIDSFKLLYNFDNVFDLKDTTTLYFLKENEQENELKRKNLQIIKDALQDFIQQPINRKKAPKPMIYQDLLNRKGFYYKYIYEQPQLNKLQDIDMNVFIYHALFKLMYVKLSSNGKDFEQQFIQLIATIYETGKQNNAFSQNEQVAIQAIVDYMQNKDINLFQKLEEIKLQSVKDFIEAHTILRAFALLQLYLKE